MADPCSDCELLPFACPMLPTCQICWLLTPLLLKTFASFAWHVSKEHKHNQNEIEFCITALLCIKTYVELFHQPVVSKIINCIIRMSNPSHRPGTASGSIEAFRFRCHSAIDLLPWYTKDRKIWYELWNVTNTADTSKILEVLDWIVKVLLQNHRSYGMNEKHLACSI